MIISKQDIASAAVDSHNRLYAEKDGHYTHKIPMAVADMLMHGALSAQPVASALDLGCGQGQMTRYLFEQASASADVAPEKFVGVDLSQVAIGQCEARHPELGWAIDKIQTFVRSPEAEAHFPNGVDLVFNKGGFLSVDSEADYETAHKGVFDLLSPQGRYVFIQSKKFYEKWKFNNTADWSRNIFNVMDDVFGPALVLDDTAYNILIYHKNPAARPAAERVARATFTFPDGKQSTFRIGSNPDIVARFGLMLESDGTADDPYAYMVRNEAGGARKDAAGGDAAGASAPPNVAGPVVLLHDGALQSFSSKAMKADSALRSTLSDIGRPVFYPRTFRTTRHLCNSIDQLLASRPMLAVIGWGLRDYYTDTHSGQAVVDPDEFELRLMWTLRMLDQYGCKTILVRPELQPGEEIEYRNLVLTADGAAPHFEVMDALADRFGGAVHWPAPPAPEVSEAPEAKPRKRLFDILRNRPAGKAPVLRRPGDFQEELVAKASELLARSGRS